MDRKKNIFKLAQVCGVDVVGCGTLRHYVCMCKCIYVCMYICTCMCICIYPVGRNALYIHVCIVLMLQGVGLWDIMYACVNVYIL